MYESCQKHITPNCSCTKLVLCGFMCASGLERGKASSSPGRFSMALEKAPRLKAWTNVTLCPVCDRSLVPRETVNFDSRESQQRERLRETKLTVSRRTSLEVICHRHIWKFWSWKFMKPRCKGAVRCYPLTSQILQRFCRETVSLIDVEWLRSNQWEGALLRRNFHPAI